VTRSKLLMVSCVSTFLFFLQSSVICQQDKFSCGYFSFSVSPSTQKRLTPSFGSNSGNLSPKRSAGMPKLNFLAQLTGRNGLKPSNANSGGGECTWNSVFFAIASHNCCFSSSHTVIDAPSSLPVAPAAALEASGLPVAPATAPGGPGRGAMSFLADIARFRKPDAEEVAAGSISATEENTAKENGVDASNAGEYFQIVLCVTAEF